MKKQIENLNKKIQEARTASIEGRQIVANACRDLYNIIEEGLHNRFGDEAVNDAYNDLLNGDFAEPFHCEKKKETFEVYRRIYVHNIL